MDTNTYSVSANSDGTVCLRDAETDRVLSWDLSAVKIEQFNNCIFITFFNGNNVVVRQHRKAL